MLRSSFIRFDSSENIEQNRKQTEIALLDPDSRKGESIGTSTVHIVYTFVVLSGTVQKHDTQDMYFSPDLTSLNLSHDSVTSFYCSSA